MEIDARVKTALQKALLHSEEAHLAAADAQKALVRAEERFLHAIETSTFSIAVAENTGLILYANPATLKILDYTEEEITAGKLRWTELILPEYFERALDAVLWP